MSIKTQAQLKTNTSKLNVIPQRDHDASLLGYLP